MFGSFFVEIGVILGLATFIAYFFVKERFKYFERKGIPNPKPAFLVGNIWRGIFLFENQKELIESFCKQFPKAGIVGYFQGLKPTYLIKDPEIVNRVLIKDFSHFHDRGLPADEETNPLEGHLFNLSGTKWKTLRNKLSPTFTSGKLKGMYHLMDKCVESFISYLDDQVDKEVEMKDALCRLTTDVIGSCAFGIDSEAIKDPECKFRVIGRRIFKPSLATFAKFLFRFFFPTIGKKLKLKTIPEDINDFFFNITKQNFKHRLETGTKRNDFMQLLLQLREKGEVDIDPVDARETEEDSYLSQVEHHVEDNGKVVLTDELLTAQAFVFFAAGFETSATSLCFVAYHLSKDQEIQDKLRSEVKAVKGKHGGFSYAALKEMKYLAACIDEGMRLHSSVPFLFRKCNKSLTLEDGTTIDKDYTVLIPVSAIHKDPANFPDPLSFNPDRFIDQEPLPGTFMPFGHGPRICIAQRFALLELKLALARIVDRYRIETCPTMKKYEPLQYDPRAFFLTPKNGIFCKLSKVSP